MLGAGACSRSITSCEDPARLTQPKGADSGFVRCDDGSLDRTTAVACEDPSPAGAACNGTETSRACETDADCKDHAYGRCIHFDRGVQVTSDGCSCAYGCKVDGDCGWLGAQNACACAGESLGFAGARCIPASCRAAGDCSSGACGVARYDRGCGTTTRLVCRTDADTCRQTSDCEGGAVCAPGAGGGVTCDGNTNCVF